MNLAAASRRIAMLETYQSERRSRLAGEILERDHAGGCAILLWSCLMGGDNWHVAFDVAVGAVRDGSPVPPGVREEWAYVWDLGRRWADDRLDEVDDEGRGYVERTLQWLGLAAG